MVGVAKGAVFQETRPGAGLKTSDFVTEKSGGRGGGTVERSVSNRCFYRSRRSVPQPTPATPASISVGVKWNCVLYFR